MRSCGEMDGGEQHLAPEPPPGASRAEVGQALLLEGFDEIADHGIAHVLVDQRFAEAQREARGIAVAGRVHEGSSPMSSPEAMLRIAASAPRSSFRPAAVTL